MTIEETSRLSFGRLDGLLGFHLRMASAAMARDFLEVLDDLGLTQAQCAVLELVAANPGVSQIDMAAALGMDRATMMAVVARLDERSLLRRSPSVRDRRRQEVVLSEQGQALLRQARRRIARHEQRFLGRLAAGEAARLTQLLRRIYT